MNFKFKKKQIRFIEDIIEKRYNIIIGLIMILFIIIAFRLFNLQVISNNKYGELLALNSVNIVESSSAPRGRIYDRNGNLLVDNKPVKTIYYKKIKGIKTSEELKLAERVASIIDIDYSKLNLTNLKEYYMQLYPDKVEKLITKEEYKKLSDRKLTKDDIYKLKLERITEEELNSKIDDFGRKCAYIYYLMNKGYSYDEKIIKNENVTEEEYAAISELANSLKGFNTKLDWERVYPYGNTFKTILGKVSNEKQGIPAELKNEYLKNGYSLNDRVGISYLEYQYENVLKGVKAKYKVLPDNSYELVSEGKRGNDIMLTIDINLQMELEKILEEEVYNAKMEANTKYYDRSMAIISDPNTGEILAMAGKQIKMTDGQYKIYDYTPGITTSPVTAGSVVKGASILVAYNEGAIQIGTTFKDECIKIKDTPEKCSWTSNLGTLNDVQALAKSSNIYQFRAAILVGKGNYVYNQPLVIDKEAFTKYRNMYNSFGLGVKTGIDLPVESTGYKGESTMSGHLLDFVIGQYDTYTPIQLSQYINTIANGGIRYQSHLLKRVYKSNKDGTLDDIKSEYEITKLNEVPTEEQYMNRVKEGFLAVMNSGGLGVGYMNASYNPAGKTGTSESFIDTDMDGVVDTETVTKTFVGYAPYDNPRMSIAIVSPDVGINGANYTSNVNKTITQRVTDAYFNIVK